MSIKKVTENYNIRGETIKVRSKHQFNDKTNKEEYNEHLDTVALNKALNKYRKSHGMILSKDIINLRHYYNLSQRDFASLLGWSPTTIVAYEEGLLPTKGHNKTLLLLLHNKYLAMKLFTETKVKMSRIGQKHFVDIMNHNRKELAKKHLIDYIHLKYQYINGTKYTGNVMFNWKKFSNTVIYFLSHMMYVPKTKLCKLLYYSDFLNFHFKKVSITGTPYAKLPYGPVPDQYHILYKLLIEDNLINYNITESGHTFYHASKKDFNSKLFSKFELNIIKFICNYFNDASAEYLSELSHKDSGWKHTPVSKKISYNYEIRPNLINKYINQIY